MRESSFAFPGQNKACVCISSQLYDRRALDTPSALPLFNSLTHLAYLTSTSPRIREIMTMDGGLERLVRMLHSFVLSPPLPESSSLIFGLSPPISPNRHTQIMNKDIVPLHYDKAAANRFTLAFQCLVNIGVRGSEPIRSRVVQAGTLDVVGCILEAWLVQRGFSNPVTSAISPTNIQPSSSRSQPSRATESREQRHARRSRESLPPGSRSLPPEEVARFWAFSNAQPPARVRNPVPAISIPSTTRTPPSTQTTNSPASATAAQTPTATEQPQATRVSRSNTLRPRSSTIRPPIPSSMQPSSTHVSPSSSAAASPSPAMNSEDSDSSIQIPSHHRQNHEEDTTTDDDEAPNRQQQQQRHRRRTGTLGATNPPPAGGDAYIIISSGADSESVGMGDVDPVAAGGTVSIGLPTQDDDLAMGAPPGAPGALPLTQPSASRLDSNNAEESSETESDRDRDIPSTTPIAAARRLSIERDHLLAGPSSASAIGPTQPLMPSSPAAVSDTELPSSSSHHHHHHHSHGTHREAEDVGFDQGSRMEVEETPRAGSIALPYVQPTDRDILSRPTPPVASTSTNIPSASATGSQSGTQTQRVPMPAPLQSYLDSHAYNHTPMQLSNQGVMMSIFRGATAAAARTTGNATIRTVPNASVGTAGVIGTGRTTTVPPAPVPVTTRTGTIRLAAATVAAGVSVGVNPGDKEGVGGGKERDGPYRDDDVLLSLQLLAYLSKYPHVRQAFYVRRAGFHPATVLQNLANAQEALKAANVATTNGKGKEREIIGQPLSGTASFIPPSSFSSINPSVVSQAKEQKSFLRSIASSTTSTVRPTGTSEKDKKAHHHHSSTPGLTPPPGVPRETNVFALVERFTFRPSGALSNRNEPRIPAEIQYWAGVIMRNACRKDDSKGGVRQCANMLCGKWESYPREFAKCRRCRKAKYCGKECQSLAWSEGHRFWCSARSEGSSTATATVAGDSESIHSHNHSPLNNEPGGVGAEGDRERRALAALGFAIAPIANPTNNEVTPELRLDEILVTPAPSPSPTGASAGSETGERDAEQEEEGRQEADMVVE